MGGADVVGACPGAHYDCDRRQLPDSLVGNSLAASTTRTPLQVVDPASGRDPLHRLGLLCTQAVDDAGTQSGHHGPTRSRVL